MSASIQIGNRTIGTGHEPFIIAEMSANHNHSIENALQIVEAAAKAKAHAVKLQTYTADTMTIDVDLPDFVINDEKSLWRGYSLHRLYEEAHTPWEWHPIIFKRCAELGLIAFSTPFDETAVDFLEELKVPAYKIASFENTDLPLIRKVAATGKPLIISTGMATLSELDEMVKTAREAGCRDLVLLKCTSTYPASPCYSHLSTIPQMKQLFNCEVGLSDHTLGIGVSIASVALGATVIERHFTLSRAQGGVDAPFSLEPDEMKMLVEESKRASEAIGKVSFGPVESEKSSMRFRRSLYITRDVKAGETLGPQNVRAIRPGYGLPVKNYDLLCGLKAKVDIRKGTPAQWDLVE